MKKIDSSLQDFLGTVTTDFNGLIGKIDQMKDNMSQLKKERNKTESELNLQRLAENTNANQQPSMQAAGSGMLLGAQSVAEEKIEEETPNVIADIEITPGDKQGR